MAHAIITTFNSNEGLANQDASSLAAPLQLHGQHCCHKKRFRPIRHLNLNCFIIYNTHIEGFPFLVHFKIRQFSFVVTLRNEPELVMGLVERRRSRRERCP